MDEDDGEALHAVKIDSRCACEDAFDDDDDDDDDVKACWMSRAVRACDGVDAISRKEFNSRVIRSME